MAPAEKKRARRLADRRAEWTLQPKEAISAASGSRWWKESRNRFLKPTGCAVEMDDSKTLKLPHLNDRNADFQAAAYLFP